MKSKQLTKKEQDKLILYGNQFVHKKYRVLPELDLTYRDFPVGEDGKYLKDNLDFFIPCNKSTDTKIYYYDTDTKGDEIFCLFIRNSGWADIKKEYKNFYKGKLNDKVIRVVSNHKETEVYFLDKDLEVFGTLAEARTWGAKIQPYDETNLKAMRKREKQ